MLREIMLDLGFEAGLMDEDFLGRVEGCIESGDREGLIVTIAGGATYEEAAQTADSIMWDAS